MNYIAKRPDGKLSNEPYVITYDDLKAMYEENQRDAEESAQVTAGTYRGESYLDPRNSAGSRISPVDMFREFLYRDAKTAGAIMGYPHGTVITQGERGSYYRGETSVHARSASTLSRALEQISSEEHRLLYRLVADMRIAEFDFFIHRFDRVRCWEENGLSVLAEPLAQHYGLETDWLDITNDFNTALFFATCKWDSGAGQWYPLTKTQIERNDDTRYGVLFHMPSWNIMTANMCAAAQSENCGIWDMEGKILPIGYQPFMRCHSQYGYGICMKTPAPLQENILFEKLRFPQSEKLSEAVFQLMDGGKNIYPQEGLDDFGDVINQIKSAAKFSEAAFLAALQKNQLEDQAGQYRARLETFRVGSETIEFCGDQHPYHVDRNRIRYANRRDKNFSIEKEYGIRLVSRPVFRPGSELEDSTECMKK